MSKCLFVSLFLCAAIIYFETFIFNVDLMLFSSCFRNSVFSKEVLAIELLKSDPPRSALKGGREKQKSGSANKSKPIDNNIEKEDSSSEDELPAQIKTNVSLKYNTVSAEVDNSVNKSSVRVSRLGSNRENDTTSKDNKPDTVVATLGKSGVGITRLSRSTEKEPDSPKSSRFQLPGRTTTTTGRLGNLENKPEEKKVEERTSLPNRYTRITTTSKEEKDDDTVANRFRYRSKLDDDNRTRKKDVSIMRNVKILIKLLRYTSYTLCISNLSHQGIRLIVRDKENNSS